MDYHSLYHKMFNAVTDALEMIEAQNFGLAKEQLMQAQKACEEWYMETQECETGG